MFLYSDFVVFICGNAGVVKEAFLKKKAFGERKLRLDGLGLGPSGLVPTQEPFYEKRSRKRIANSNPVSRRVFLFTKKKISEKKNI